MGILTRFSFFCTQRVEKDMILLELTVFKAAPQLSFAKLCDLLKHSRMQTCPNQSEETCIIFNQSGVELGLLAPCISRAFPPLENGTRANEFCDVTILYLFVNETFFSNTVTITKLFCNTDSLFGSSSSSPARYATRKRNR